MRESVPRKVDKKSRVPKEEIAVWNSQGGGKNKCLFFPLHSLVLVTQTFFFFFFKPRTDDYTTNNSV